MQNKNISVPLPELVRPDDISKIIGQDKILSVGKPLRTMIDNDNYRSFILWGPPGSGKTSIAKIIEAKTKQNFLSFSAVQSGIQEIKKIMKQAKYLFLNKNLSTILFVDEIHRFNKSQQDAFLPYVESGYIILIGATTENPSFEVIPALLSRCQIFVLNPLTEQNVYLILENAVEKLKLNKNSTLLRFIASISGGDARKALNYLDIVISQNESDLSNLSVEQASQILSKNYRLYDKNGEKHYNLISAFHKAIRGSDPNASLYWLARMLEAGEDPKFIARRLIRIATEDIGLADPQALNLAISTMQAVNFIGLPEADLALAQTTIYLAISPKSNSIYIAYKKAKLDANRFSNLSVPLHLRNAPTKLMKNLNYGIQYKYPHNFPYHFVDQNYFPDDMPENQYYTPGEFGFEKDITKRLKWFKKLKLESKDN